MKVIETEHNEELKVCVLDAYVLVRSPCSVRSFLQTQVVTYISFPCLPWNWQPFYGRCPFRMVLTLHTGSDSVLISGEPTRGILGNSVKPLVSLAPSVFA